MKRFKSEQTKQAAVGLVRGGTPVAQDLCPDCKDPRCHTHRQQSSNEGNKDG